MAYSPWRLLNEEIHVISSFHHLLHKDQFKSRYYQKKSSFDKNLFWSAMNMLHQFLYVKYFLKNVGFRKKVFIYD